MTRKANIIYIIDDLAVAGAQVHLYRLINRLVSKFNIEIISLSAFSNDLASKLPTTVKHSMFVMDSIRSPWFFLDFIKLTAYLRWQRPDIVHTYLNTSNVFGLLAARLAGVKHIITSRRDMGGFQTKRMAVVEGFLSRYFAKKVVCVCNAAAKVAYENHKIPNRKISVIYNGINIKEFQPRQKAAFDDRDICFSMVATMNRPEKGHVDLIKAISLLSDQYKEKARFSLIGDGPLRKNLEALVNQLGLVDKIKFHGTVFDLRPIFSKTDVLVLPSHSEGISNAALEAMACGIPVIATSVDGNLEVLINNTTGILVPKEDTKALCKSFITYIDNPSLIKEHGINARKRVEKMFSIEIMARKYSKLYHEFIN